VDGYHQILASSIFFIYRVCRIGPVTLLNVFFIICVYCMFFMYVCVFCFVFYLLDIVS
jgi:hypothetical protein